MTQEQSVRWNEIRSYFDNKSNLLKDEFQKTIFDIEDSYRKARHELEDEKTKFFIECKKKMREATEIYISQRRDVVKENSMRNRALEQARQAEYAKFKSSLEEG